MKWKGSENGVPGFVVLFAFLFILAVLKSAWDWLLKVDNISMRVVVALIAGIVVGGFVLYLLLNRLNAIERFAYGVAIIVAIGTGVLTLKFLNNMSTATENSKTADTILLTGKVIDSTTGAWNNNRLVVVFERNTEVGRTVSSRGEFPESKQGVIDGLFMVAIPNNYRFTIGDLKRIISPYQFSYAEHPYNVSGQYEYLYYWFGDVTQGSSRIISIPFKNLDYHIKVLVGDISQLPLEIQQPGSIALVEGNRMVAVDPNADASIPESVLDNSNTIFLQAIEEMQEKPLEKVSYNNCQGVTGFTIQKDYTSVHEITNTEGEKLGIELPVLTWLKFVAAIEKQYDIKDQEIKSTSITLVVPPGENIEFSVKNQQTWQSGIAMLNANGVDISIPYKFLKDEKIVYEQIKLTCP